jgi:hypothetical protein
MAGFTSMDDLLSEITANGKFFRSDWNKNMLPTTAAVAGEWSFLARIMRQLSAMRPRNKR